MFQVLRWGALAFGVFYGFTHQTAISSRDKIAAEKHDYERKEKLISDAKAAWAKKNAPAGQSSGCKSYQDACNCQEEVKREEVGHQTVHGTRKQLDYTLELSCWHALTR